MLDEHRVHYPNCIYKKSEPAILIVAPAVQGDTTTCTDEGMVTRIIDDWNK
jgi:hypothetical protein